MIRTTILAIALAFFNLSPAYALLSDDFNIATGEVNPTWRFYDPYDTTAGADAGQSTLSFDGANAIISIPSGLTHDLWRPSATLNKAPRLLQPQTNTDFHVEMKVETIPNAATQLQGLIVQQSNDIFLRFDIYYDGTNTPRALVGFVNGPANTSVTHLSVPLAETSNNQYRNYPKYRRIQRSGNQWTFRYSYDRVTWTTAVTFTQAMTVTEIGFFAGTSGNNPSLLSSVDYFIDVATPINDIDTWIAPPPVINTWYGYSQAFGIFGLPGRSQQWANILGNVFSHADLSTLTYRLDSGPVQNLSFGPDTHQATREDGRLVRTGDFNIEIDQSQFNQVSPSLHTIQITATDINGTQHSQNVTLDYDPGNVWPLPYTANWQSVDTQHIESIAHVVDGLWNITGSGVRVSQRGYDRAIAIGDMNWQPHYEVTVPFTLHSGFNGIGFAVGWQGHTGSQSPRIEWPLEALAWVRGPLSNPTLEIITYGGLVGWELVQAVQPVTIATNTTYLLKGRTEVLNNTTSRFSVKLWPQSGAEPATWTLSADVPKRLGSVLLVALKTEATFGNVVISDIGSPPPVDMTPPLISNVQATNISNSGATITWTTNEASNSVVNYGLTNAYGSNASSATLVTNHSVNLTGLSPNIMYHYRVNSTDAGSNPSSSTDFTFTTAASGGSSPSGLVSDSFTGALNTNLWSFYDPLSNSSLSTTGSQASISVPASSNHDLWTNALNAPRIRQAANNTDFQIEAKFDSNVTNRFQMQGLTVEQNNTNLLRFDVYYDGTVTRIFSASIVNGTASNRISAIIANGAPKYLRVNRSGNLWSLSYSSNGTTWTTAGSYSHTLSVTAVGLFTGNSGSPIPAHTALVDYFMVDNIQPGSGGDTNAPVISNIQATSLTSSSATITWTTNEASNSVVNYGLTNAYGSNASNVTLVTSHSINLTGLIPNTSYHYRVASTDTSTNTAFSNDLTFTTLASGSGIVADEFNGNLNTGLWSFYDPVGNSALNTTGSQASISVPAGSAHDLWTNALNAPRIRQAVNNTDFEIEVKFDSLLSSRFQMNGVTVEQNNTNLLRFDFYSDGSVTRIFSASFVNGSPTNRISTVITNGSPKYLRINRVGNQWTVSYSNDGSTWTVAGVYTHALTVSSIGLFAGNSGSPVPAHTALIDYFRVH